MLLTVEGDHVPVTPLLDVVGNTGAVEPLHIGVTGAKEGIVVFILKLKQAGGATLLHKSVTEPEIFVRQTWNEPLVVIAGFNVRTILFP